MYSHVSTAAHVSSIPAAPSRKGALPAAPQFAAVSSTHSSIFVLSSSRPVPSSPFLCHAWATLSQRLSYTQSWPSISAFARAQVDGDGGPVDLDNLSPCMSTFLMYLTPPSYVMMEIRPERAQPESIRPSSMQPTAQLHCTVLPAVRTRAGTGAAILCLMPCASMIHARRPSSVGCRWGSSRQNLEVVARVLQPGATSPELSVPAQRIALR
jgi:hypothetical protein